MYNKQKEKKILMYILKTTVILNYVNKNDNLWNSNNKLFIYKSYNKAVRNNSKMML